MTNVINRFIEKDWKQLFLFENNLAVRVNILYKSEWVEIDPVGFPSVNPLTTGVRHQICDFF